MITLADGLTYLALWVGVGIMLYIALRHRRRRP